MSTLDGLLGHKIDPGYQLRGVELFLAEAGAVGVDVADAMPDVVAAVTLARSLTTRSAGDQVDIAALQVQLADQVLSGALDLDEALDRVAEADRQNARGSASGVLLELIAKNATRRAWAVFTGYGTRILSEVLEPANARIIGEVQKLAPKVLDVTSDRDAMRRKLADPWQALTEAFERWEQLHQIAHAIRNNGFDKSSRKRPVDFAPHELAFREYLRTTEYRRRDFAHGGVWLYHAAAVGEPGVLTLGEGERLARRDEARAADALRNPKEIGRPPELRDKYGDKAAVVDALDDTTRRSTVDRILG